VSEQSAKNPESEEKGAYEIYAETKSGVKRYTSLQYAIRGVVRGSVYSAAFRAKPPACGWIVMLPDVHNDYMLWLMVTDVNPLVNKSFTTTPPIKVSAKALLDSVLGRW